MQEITFIGSTSSSYMFGKRGKDKGKRKSRLRQALDAAKQNYQSTATKTRLGKVIHDSNVGGRIGGKIVTPAGIALGSGLGLIAGGTALPTTKGRLIGAIGGGLLGAGAGKVIGGSLGKIGGAGVGAVRGLLQPNKKPDKSYIETMKGKK